MIVVLHVEVTMNLYYPRIISLSLLCSILFLSSCDSVTPKGPDLIVMISIDQMRPDRLTPELPGGLGRLVREGYVFSNATLDHGLTTTCPGHIVMSTGMNPMNTGIPGNSYTDHQTGGERYCVDDPDSNHIVLGSDETRSPNAITSSSIGEWLTSASPGSKVYSVSGKDRAAIAMAGKRADGVFWFHSGLGRFTTTSYFSKELPGYVNEVNGSSFFENGYAMTAPATWEHAGGTYREDDFQGEGTMHGRVSGHPLNTGPGSNNQFYFSPWLDLATGELARAIVDEEELGARGVTDYLAISFSATDLVGHLYGPFSAESEDALEKLDEEIGRLLEVLDRKTAGNYILALSADHGVQPLPEHQVRQDDMNCPVGNGRLDIAEMDRFVFGQAIDALGVPADQAQQLIGLSAEGTTINRATADSLGLDFDKVVSTLEQIYENHPAIAAAWTVVELMESNDEFARLYRNSFVEGKSAHIVPQPHEDCLIWRPDGTTHGSPWMYDRAVPLIFYGAGIRTGSTAVQAHSIDMAPTLADRAGLAVPEGRDGTIRREVFVASD